MEVFIGVKGAVGSVCQILSSTEWFIVISYKVGNVFSSRTEELRTRRCHC